MSDHGHGHAPSHAPKAAHSAPKSSHGGSSGGGIEIDLGIGGFFSAAMGLFTQTISNTVNDVLGGCNNLVGDLFLGGSGGGGGGGGGHGGGGHGHGH